MKVFLSWSGTRSEKVAELLKEWLPYVLQASDPWVSTSDIDRGAQWFNSIQGQLQETTTGIICLTQENKEKPWILFEAGALAKGLSDASVCTLLIDLEPQHVRPPLGQFNHTQANKSDLFKLICTLNGRLEKSLNMTSLQHAFNTQWPYFEEQFDEIIKATQNDTVSHQVPIRAQDDILAEILDNTRALNSRLVELENNQSLYEKNLYEWRLLNQKIPIKELQNNDYIDRLRELEKEGLSAVEIGEKLNVPTAEVIMLLRKHGIPRRFRL
ncbi:MAG TPA: toll-Interleukin receptor [Aeromonas salmonicida]|nr:toll-Interleukin receptor [Aeromonas salmonicida]HBL04265.1 toll-Interleukin receptor [Aeromonas salmonicida]